MRSASWRQFWHQRQCVTVARDATCPFPRLQVWNKITSRWNEISHDMTNSVVDACTVNAFKARLDKFRQQQLVKFDFTADLTGTENRSGEVIKWYCLFMIVYDDDADLEVPDARVRNSLLSWVEYDNGQNTARNGAQCAYRRRSCFSWVRWAHLSRAVIKIFSPLLGINSYVFNCSSSQKDWKVKYWRGLAMSPSVKGCHQNFQSIIGYIFIRV